MRAIIQSIVQETQVRDRASCIGGTILIINKWSIRIFNIVGNGRHRPKQRTLWIHGGIGHEI